MENKSHALIAGIFTLVLLVAAVLIALWLNRDRVERIPYEMVTKSSIPGLSPQATVRYRGLDVGRVDDIIFDPTVPGQILVRMSVRPDTPMTKSTFGTLGYQGVTGIAYIQLDDDGTSPVRLTSSEKNVARIEMRPSLFENLQNRGLAILTQTEELARRVNVLLAPENQKTMLGAFESVTKAANQLEAIPRQLEPTLAKLPAVATEAQQTLVAITRLTKDVNALTTSLQASNGPIRKIGDTADQIGAVANRFENEVLPLTSDARSTMRSINRTMESFNNRSQSFLFGSPANMPGPGEEGFSAAQ